MKINHGWYTFEISVDVNKTTYAKLIGYTSQVPTVYRDAIRHLISYGVVGAARLHPNDSFNLHIGSICAINRAVSMLHRMMLKSARLVSEMWRASYRSIHDPDS